MSGDPSGLPPFPREAWNEGGEDLTSGISGVSEPYSANYEELSLLEEVRDLKSELNGLKIESQLKIDALTHQLDHRDEVEEDLEKTRKELKVANEKIEELRQEVIMASMLSNVSSNISSNLSSNISCDDYPPQSRCSECVELSCALEKRKKEVKDLEVMLKESEDELKKRKLTDSAKKGSLSRKTLFGGNEMVRLEKAKEEIEELKKVIHHGCISYVYASWVYLLCVYIMGVSLISYVCTSWVYLLCVYIMGVSLMCVQHGCIS